jgi:hypothetical protein
VTVDPASATETFSGAEAARDHTLDGGFGEVTLGTNMRAAGGHLSAFANVSIRFPSDNRATSVTAGFRYQG